MPLLQFHNPEQTTHRYHFPHYVYYIECPDDDTVRVALQPVLTTHGDGTGKMFWWDPSYPNHDRTRQVVAIGRKGDVVMFREAGDGGRIYRMEPLTLELYDAKVKPTLITPQDFESMEELEAAYREDCNWW